MTKPTGSILFIDRKSIISENLFSGIELNTAIMPWEHQFPTAMQLLADDARQTIVDFEEVDDSIAIVTGQNGTWAERGGIPLAKQSEADSLKQMLENRLTVRLQPPLSPKELPAMLGICASVAGKPTKCLVLLHIKNMEDLPHFQNVVARDRYEQESLYNDVHKDLGVSLKYSVNDGIMRGLASLATVASTQTFTLPVAIRMGDELELGAIMLLLDFHDGESRATLYTSNVHTVVSAGTELLFVGQLPGDALPRVQKLGIVTKILD